jgi:hypothetical protein
MEQQSSPVTPQNQLKAANILFNALLLGVLLFQAIAIAVIKFNGRLSAFNNHVETAFLILALTIALICLMSALSGYRKRLGSIDKSVVNFDQRFDNYRTAMIFYMALCEFPALFAIIAFMLTGNYWFVAISLVMLGAMMFKQPTKARVIRELELGSQDQQQL